jgi:LmbE family N-acetylglucosaminyl deacetylase
LRILVVVAHPDDDILGVGGTMLKHSNKGDSIKVIFLATGITSRKKSGHTNSTKYEISKKEEEVLSEEIKVLRFQAQKACKLLSVNNVDFYDFPDNEMDSIPLLKVVKTIEKEINDFKPEKIFTHHYGDLNIDHRVVYNATITACRPINNTVKEIICFEVPSSTEWNYPNTFVPNYFVNISKQLDKKIKAMEVYTSEIQKFPHPRSSEYLKINANRWGGVSGNIAAEAFEIIRKIDK